ncbi:8-amino-7-oxononanoate synthase [Zymomonas mobilis subsp. mobilis ZM4 = ATCC 31821]|uniref:8-amino-7-oxononanoate synthase n=2 Tax=Zymomonas mobilis TaxID=542 RepID=Q5NN16_ZYMMO|nr:8-amino-7-oxononanoate synthase [Zymomonas mobilis subsp. mobilis ZM4 = ATCC 31821]AHB09407.1 serine palmitoyltransferase [Zymomonas mobilis subsp. mobilis str. CP4 = NRRL B-14023]AHJ69713.1 putative pyridoxal phosphate-dependent acyltransferase [Zymomonas mobilis subsp. mobilis NRRL B-12526]AVZ26144.1 8-amino-7-oxononanoate synthase [Zymomonas mobilis subsp. mobilis]MCP9307855.1 aminotransferase class I/II-fold pyridoxal phosphate-dependent enzyme [Zymomonas mobilis]
MQVTDLFSKFDPLIAIRKEMLSHGGRDPFAVVMEKVLSPTKAIIKGKPVILLGTYNYMGMTFDPDVIAAGEKALKEFGAGTTGSRVLNGTYQGHKACEEALKDYYGMEHAMVFSTGYQANLGMISTLAGKGEYVIIDADSHASIYDGCRLGNAEIIRFRHNSPEDLDRRLARLPKEAGKLVVLEGVYSMLGDIAPLAEMVAIAKKHDALILDDEAHGMGFFGKNGRGVFEELGLEGQIDFIVGTFSKSVGTVGGFCVSNHPQFEVLRLVCRPYVFTASLPPSVVATAEASIRKLQKANDKREHLWKNSRRLHGGLKEMGFKLGTETAQSAIIAVILPDQEQAVAMWQNLLELGLYVNLARPPATPAGMFLLRCSLCAEHSDDDVTEILAMFKKAGQATGVLAA